MTIWTRIQTFFGDVLAWLQLRTQSARVAMRRVPRRRLALWGLVALVVVGVVWSLVEDVTAVPSQTTADGTSEDVPPAEPDAPAGPLPQGYLAKLAGTTAYPGCVSYRGDVEAVGTVRRVGDCSRTLLVTLEAASEGDALRAQSESAAAGLPAETAGTRITFTVPKWGVTLTPHGDAYSLVRPWSLVANFDGDRRQLTTVTGRLLRVDTDGI